MRKPQPLTAKPIRIPKTVFTPPHPQKTWSTLFWSLFHLPPYRDIKSRGPLKHLHAHKIWGPWDPHLPHRPSLSTIPEACYMKVQPRSPASKYHSVAEGTSPPTWVTSFIKKNAPPPRRTTLRFSSVLLAVSQCSDGLKIWRWRVGLGRRALYENIFISVIFW